MVADDALKLDYVSVIFVAAQVNEMMLYRS